MDASRAVAAQPTGTENYSQFLIRAMLEVDKHNRYRLYFNQAPATGLFPRDEQVEWSVIPWPRLWTHLRLMWEVNRRPPDVLYVPSHVLPLLHPPRCVATVHDLGYVHFPEAHGRWSRRYLDWSTRFNARQARRIIVDSEATRRDLASCYGIGLDKMVVAYPAGAEGLAAELHASRIDALKRRYGISGPYYCYVGTLQPRKNLETLISAFTRLVTGEQIAPNTQLVLAGRIGWMADEIVDKARDARLAGRILLPGYVPSEDLSALLSGALAFVMPSWYEGFGLPVLEAMACDTPVICSSASSLPEVAGDAALLIEPADTDGLARAMLQVYLDSDLRRELIRRGRERLALFSWERCARTVLQAIEAVGAEA